MKSKFALLFAVTALLASCGGNSTTSHASGLSVSSEESALYLDWVADNKIVIDLFDTGNASFTYGNAALDKASNTLDLSDSAALACSSELEREPVFNFVYITEAISGTGFNAGAALYPKIEGDKIAEFLRDSADLRGKTRAYIAISSGNTVQWTKGKNAAMDAKIQQLIDTSNL